MLLGAEDLDQNDLSGDEDIHSDIDSQCDGPDSPVVGDSDSEPEDYEASQPSTQKIVHLSRSQLLMERCYPSSIGQTGDDVQSVKTLDYSRKKEAAKALLKTAGRISKVSSSKYVCVLSCIALSPSKMWLMYFYFVY